MANKKIQATAQLFLSTKDAQKDAQKFIADLKQKLSDIESAADKMTVFKDMVDYIAQVDRAMSDLKKHNKDAFSHMFDGLDTNLKKQLESVFSVDGGQLGQLDILRERLSSITTKSRITEIKKFAKELNALYASVGMDIPFANIDAQFTGRTTQKYIDNLTDKVSLFGYVWKDVNAQISKGFGGTGSGGIESAKIEKEIKGLETHLTKYKQLKAELQNLSQARESFLETEWLDESISIEYTIDSMKQLAEEFKIAKKLKEDFEASGDTSSLEYYQALSRFAKTTLQANDVWTNSIMGDKALIKELKGIKFDKGNLYDAINDIIDPDNEEIFDDLTGNINKIIDKTEARIVELNEKLSTIGNSFGDGSGVSGGVENIGDAASRAEDKVDALGKKLINVSEYVSALSGQLKEMFSATSRNANFEYHLAIDGLDIKARHGSEKSVDLQTQAATYLDTLFSESAIYGHSHRGGISATNISDVENVLSSYKDGVSIPVHFVVGKDSITTIDFTGLSKDMVDQLMQEIDATNDIKNAMLKYDTVNKIAEKFTGRSDALKTWNVDQFDELAKYLYDVQSAATSALTPIEKFQAVLDNMFGKGKVDASKYESLLSGLNKDNSKSIFNQIASIEKLQTIDKTDMLTMGQVNAEIDESIAKFKTLREEANLSYSDIRSEVDKVIEHYKSGGTVLTGLDFFQQYFPEGEWQSVRDLLTEAYDGLISIEEVTNRIANEFGVDPETFAQIPTGVNIQQFDNQRLDDDELSDIQRENGALEDRLEILRDIADAYGVQISQKDRNRYEELNTKEMEDGLTSREEDRMSELSDKIDEADSNLLEFEQTYDRITLKLSNGKKIEILPDDDGLRKLYKISNEYDNGEYNGFEIDDIIFERKQEQAVIEENNQKLREQEQLWENVKIAIKNGIGEAVSLDSLAETLELIEREIKEGILTSIEECIARFKEWNNISEEESLTFIGERERIIDGHNYGTYLLGADEVVDKEEADKLRQLSIQQEQLYQNLRSAIKGTLSDVVDVDDMTYAFDTIEKEIQSGLLTTLDQCIERFQLLTGLDDNRLTSIRDGQRVADDWDYYRGDVSSYDYEAAEQAAEEAQKRAEEAESDALRYQEAANRLLDEKSELQREVDTLREQLTTQTDTGYKSQLTQEEVAQLEALQQKLLEVKAAVDAKTQAFEEEYVTVDSVVDAEIVSLQSLVDQLEAVAKQVKLVSDAFDGINTPTPSVESNDVSTENTHYLTDSRGNRKLMYRGVNGSIGGLVSNRYHGGTFFTDLESLAKRYAGIDGKVETANISMKNPFEIDAHEHQWNDLLYIGHGADEASKKIHQLRYDIKDLEMQLNSLFDEYGAIEDIDLHSKLTDDLSASKSELKAIYDDPSNPYGKYDTNTLVEYAKSAGYDGVIFRNIKDGTNEISNIVVTLQENQIHFVETLKTTFDSLLTDFIGSFGKIEDFLSYYNEFKTDKTLFHEVDDGIRPVFGNQLDKYEELAMLGEPEIINEFLNKNKILGAYDKRVPGGLDGLLNIRDTEERIDSIVNFYLNSIYELERIQEAFNTKATSVEQYQREQSGKLTSYDKLSAINSGYDDRDFNHRESSKYADAIIEDLHAKKDQAIAATNAFHELFASFDAETANPEQLKEVIDSFINAVKLIDDAQSMATSIVENRTGAPDQAAMRDFHELGPIRETLTYDYLDMLQAEAKEMQQLEIDMLNAQEQRIKVEQEATNTVNKKQPADIISEETVQAEIGQLNQLGVVLGEVKNAVIAKTKAFYDEGTVVGQVVGKEISALKNLLGILDEIVSKVNTLSAKIVSIKPIDFVAQDGTDNADTSVATTPTENRFETRVSHKKGAMTKYIDELNGVQYVTDETREKLVALRDAMDTVKTPKDLNGIIEKFEALQTRIGILKETFEDTGLAPIRGAKNSLLSSFKTLNLDQQLDVEKGLDEAILKLNTYENDVLNGHKVELKSINDTVKALREKIEAYKEANKEAKKTGVSTGGNASFGSTASINATAKYNSLTRIATSKQFANSSEVANRLEQYKKAYDKLIATRDRLRTQDTIDESDRETFKSLTTECNEYAKALDRLIQNTLKLKGNKANPDDYMLGADFNYSDVESRKAALADFAKQMYGVDVAATDFKDNWNKVVFAVKNGDGTFTQMTATFTDARNEIVAMAGDTKKVQSALSSFIEGFQGRVKSLAQYFLATISIYDVWRIIKQGIQYVRDIDLALTELKKVTDETEESYDRFLQTASKTASEIGSTVADFVNATADFARLGYNIEQAHDLAQAASVYKNVGDGIDDVAQASESIISTMKAFGIEANNAMGIVDRFNEVGNNFAISSTGIGEAMQRSASALYEAGNTIDESIALITGANSVIQNPEQVGTALKTLALRLRGAKVELEEAGEDVDGMAESTSQLQAKLKALTHGRVDIMLDNNTFKNTTQILREMAGAWEYMTDIERASALELMGGKRQANILASVIKNFDTVEDVITTSADSAGSALLENEKYLSSIQGRIDLFNNSVQTMWMNFIDSDVVKFIVDVGTGLIKLVDTIGIIPSALAGVALYFTAIKKNNPVTIFKDLSSSIQQYSNMVQQVGSINSLVGPLKTMDMDTFNAGPVHAYAAAVSNLTAKQQAATLAAQGLNSEQIAAVLGANNLEAANIKLAMSEAGVTQAKQNNTAATGLQAVLAIKQKDIALSQQAQNFLLAHSTDVVTKSMLAKGVAQGLITHQDAVTILKSGMVTTANYAQALSWKALGTAIKSAFLSNPVGMILMLISVIAPLISELGDLVDTTEEVAEAADKAIDKYKEVQNTLKDSKRTISEISGDYEKLAKGVDELGNNVSLSTSEYERYNEIVNRIADMFPDMVKGYTDEGNAIIKNKGSVEALTKAYAELREQANAELLLGGKDIMQNYQNTTGGSFWQWDTSIPDNIKAANELKNVFDNIETYNFDALGTRSTSQIFDNMLRLLEGAGIEYLNADEKYTDYVKRAVTEFPGIVQGIINSWEAQANAAVSQVKPLVQAYLDTSLGYAGLTSDQKKMVDAIASDFDAEFFNKFNGDASKMYSAIENIILSIQSAGIDDKFSTTLDVQTKFNNGELTYDEYIAQINAFVTILDKLQADGVLDAETVLSLKVFFDIQPDETNINTALINSAKDLLDDEGDTQVGGILTKSDLEIVDKYKEEWEGLYGTNITLTKLKELIRGIREEAGEFSISSMIDDIDTVQSDFSKLGDAYEEFDENGIVTAGTLAEIQESFGNVEGFDNYIAVLGNSSSSMDDVKTALSGLATAYLNTSGVLNNLTEENEAFVISQLKAFGVTNAEEYIADIRAVQEAMAEQYGIDLSNYATVEAMKQAISADIYNAIMSINDDQVADLAKKYGVDLSNFATVEQQKTAIAIAQAKARALADKQSAQSSAQQQANAKMNATTVQKGQIKGSGIFGTGFLAGNKLVGKSYEEVLAAYNSGEYDNKSWKGQVKSWLDTVYSTAQQEINNANKAIQETYDKTIFELEDTYAKYSSLDDYVAQYNPQLSIDASKLGGPDSDNNKSGSDSANDFEQTLDWVEIRLEEINEQIDLMNAKLENAVDYASKNNIIDGIIGYNKTKMQNLTAGIQKYAEYAAGLLLDIPEQYREAAQNGAIAISDFVVEDDKETAESYEATVKAIEKYREWAQKVADYKQQLEEANKEIRDLAKLKFDNASTAFDNEIEEKFQSDQDVIEAEIGYLEEQGKRVDPKLYEKLIGIQEEEQAVLEDKKATLENILATEVATGRVPVGSEQWYEMVNAINDVDEAIIQSKNDIESWKNSMNDLYWDNLDKLISQIDAVNSELSNLFDLLSEDDKVVDEFGNWTDEGIASLALLAQQMENAQAKANEYAKAIKDLEGSRDNYSLDEYNEKMAELKDNYLSEIKNLEDAKDAMVDLNKVRVDAVKEAIDKEIEALEEKNEKLKEELDLEKEQYDFQKQVAEQEKSMADIQRRLNALAGDNSASAIAERRKLQAELAEAQQEMDDMWYEHSIEEQQKSLDDSLENYKENKEDEKEALDKWLEDEEKVIQESFDLFNSNVDIVSSVLKAFEEEHGINLTDAIVNPWNSGIDAIIAYRQELEKMRKAQEDEKENAEDAADDIVKSLNKPQTTPSTTAPTSPNTTVPDKTPDNTPKSPSVGETVVVRKDATHWSRDGGNGKRMDSWVSGSSFIVSQIDGDEVLLSRNRTPIGWLKQNQLEGYYKGTTGVKDDQWAFTDELGPELTLHAGPNGQLQYLTKGSGVVTADLTKRLMEWGELDPSQVLKNSAPKLGAPHITTNNMEINLRINEVVHIDHADSNSIQDITSAVQKQMDQYMKNVNQSLKRFAR